MFISLETGKFVFQKSLSETPFKQDRVSFCTPNNACCGGGGGNTANGAKCATPKTILITKTNNYSYNRLRIVGWSQHEGVSPPRGGS